LALGEASQGLLPPKALKISSTSNTTSPRGSLPSIREFDPSKTTLDVGTNGPSRVGWTRSNSANTGRDRWRLFALVSGALTLGLLVMVFFLKRTPSPITPTDTLQAPADAAVEPRPTPTNDPTSATPATANSATANATSSGKKPPTAKPNATSAKPKASSQAPPNDKNGAPQLKIKTE